MNRREVEQALRALKDAGDSAGCIKVLRGLGDHGLEPTTVQYNICISSMSKNWRGALDLLNEMESKGIHADTVSFSSAISVCGRAGASRFASFYFPSTIESPVRAAAVENNAYFFAGRAMRTCA